MEQNSSPKNSTVLIEMPTQEPPKVKKKHMIHYRRKGLGSTIVTEKTVLLGKATQEPPKLKEKYWSEINSRKA